MYMKSLQDVETLRDTLDQCEGEVWLQSATDYYNLKSELSQYVGLAQLFDKNNDLEMFASQKSDEMRLINMFADNPDMAACL